MKKTSVKDVLALFSLIFVLWGIYRYFPNLLPTWAEELILKPLLWLTPTYLIVLKQEKLSLATLGYTTKKLFPSLYWGIGLGLVLAFEGFLAHLVKYGQIRFSPPGNSSNLAFLGVFLLSFATAFTEESVFRGFIFKRLNVLWQNEIKANLTSSFLFSLIHLPVGIFVLSYTPVIMLIYLFLVFIFAFASAFIFARTNNLISSILLHVFWSWPIILFK